MTAYHFPDQTGFYRGKVRDVYSLSNGLLIMIASDRISAFDVILPRLIPYKGQVLNQIAAYMLKATHDICPNWLLSVPTPNASIGKRCDPFRVEMVVRGNLTGHAWRTYSSGQRVLCGVPMPAGLKENDYFPSPIITPSTKAETGHDEDISKEEILTRGIVTKRDYETLEAYTLNLYAIGTELASQRNLILVDTKYEFGKHNGKIYLIDEVHTPDSSRYFYKEGYEQRQRAGEQQKQLSKEFVRQWLIENGFQGKEGQQVPAMTDEIVANISARYKELYQQMMGKPINAINYSDILERIESSIVNSIN